MATFFYFCIVNEITLIGSGNVAWHLCPAFLSLGFSVSLFSRNTAASKEFQDKFDVQLIPGIESVRDQLVILCVTDSEIAAVLNLLDSSNRVAYTSGTTELNSLPHRENLGVFYPLQTFSKARRLDLFEVPFFIEATNTYFAQELFDLAWKLSHKVEFADSGTRKELHLAAVISNNFTNFLLTLAKEYLEARNLSWGHLGPLVRETVEKALEIGPEKAQTGPATRDDKNTIRKHQEMLSPPLKEIYHLLSNAILEHSKHEKL
ncbi:MAG: Conserved putative Pyrroline-5-carboxylate reductase [Crocinitomicaceae bacterium]|jgi:predicted short-subunit dehydrogenase-like oxidoreductase (DUF2520 family)|nr:Conserved putative Pyrroline-5-carboxylate reductase [Crocinitomicaceae bacterium]